MKKFILIILIFCVASSLKSQAIGPNAKLFVIKNITGDTLMLPSSKMPFPGPRETITVSTIIIEPPTSFKMQIAIPIDSLKQKSSQWQDLKSQIKEIPHLKVKIVGLVLIGTWMYCFRDDLQAWSKDNDKAAHLFLSYGLSKFFGWKFALGFMLSIEATQSDIFGTEGRYQDTFEDVFIDIIGIGFSLKL